MKILADRHTRILLYTILGCIAVFSLISSGLLYFHPAHAALCIFLCALCMGLAILTAWYGYFRIQNRILENAASQIRAYTEGDVTARIECDREGELYRLFHEINSLASILNAQAENELRAKEFLKNTISDISHQLKTPLTALNIYNGLLQNEAQDLPEIKEFSDLSEQELDRISTLVQNLLKITKLDARTISLNKRKENLTEMISRTQKHFSFRAEQEGKNICLTGEKDITLYCDRDWLTEALDNIVKNALDHTRAGGQIHISWKQFAAAVQITIKDNGSGIHPEDLHHIFKRFYRSRFSMDTQGIGLGLPLAKAIVEEHNGTIEADSEPGRGTTFTLTFLKPLG
ncbi:MAG: HAMP domain-containing histidine kinase [Clostridiales bacterium]|nr:HAMP domain-containing histidine kinase [Clostridiales bacterium]